MRKITALQKFISQFNADQWNTLSANPHFCDAIARHDLPAASVIAQRILNK